MKHPVIALTWACWRHSRRWLCWILPAAVGINLLLINMQVLRIPDAELSRQLMAVAAFMMNFALALFATLLAVTLSGRNGFPFIFEYRLPLATPVLVVVPMLYLGLACAALLFIPLLIGRLFYDLPFPLLPASVILIVLVAALLASSWCTTTTGTRLLAQIACFSLGIRLFTWLDPFQLPQGMGNAPPVLRANIMALTLSEYVLLALLWMLLFAITVKCVQQQRADESYGLLKLLRESRQASNKRSRIFSLLASSSAMQEWISDSLALPCPTSSPWRAELWVELKRHIVPLLLMSMVMSLAIPLLLGATTIENPVYSRMLELLPLFVIFSGLGLAIFNRRQATRGYFSAFEGTRCMRTMSMVSLQLLGVGGIMLLGALLVSGSLLLAANLFEANAGLGVVLRFLLALFHNQSVPGMMATSLTLLQWYLCIIAFFACLQGCSIIWERKFLFGMVAVAFYGLVFAALIGNEAVGAEAIKRHMWGVALVVAAITALLLARILQLEILHKRTVALALSGWGLLVLVTIYFLSQHGVQFQVLAPELLALYAALLTLPLMLYLGTAWCYDRLRHQ